MLAHVWNLRRRSLLAVRASSVALGWWESGFVPWQYCARSYVGQSALAPPSAINEFAQRQTIVRIPMKTIVLLLSLLASTGVFAAGKILFETVEVVQEGLGFGEIVQDANRWVTSPKCRVRWRPSLMD